jgi:very-long-chain (3R)-3-hydroxyacyl-CoA dehydratase
MTSSQLLKLYNFSQAISWSLLIPLLLCSFCNEKIFHIEITTHIVILLRIVQTIQILDIYFAFKGVTPNLFGSLLQVVGRLIVTWLIIDRHTSLNILVNVLIPWSFAEVIRFLYYLDIDYRGKRVIPWLRYNAFIVLYPIGVFGEVRAIEEKRSQSSINSIFFFVLEFTIIGGLFFLYYYMLRQRRKFNQKAKGSLKIEDKSDKIEKTD